MIPAHARNALQPPAMQDYLERILELINTEGYARVVDITESLKISQASATNIFVPKALSSHGTLGK